MSIYTLATDDLGVQTLTPLPDGAVAAFVNDNFALLSDLVGRCVRVAFLADAGPGGETTAVFPDGVQSVDVGGRNLIGLGYLSAADYVQAPTIKFGDGTEIGKSGDVLVYRTPDGELDLRPATVQGFGGDVQFTNGTGGLSTIHVSNGLITGVEEGSGGA